MTNTSVSEVPVRETDWVNITFFAFTTLMGIPVALFYLFHNHGMSLPEFLLFAFYLVVTPLGITMGYHRCFAHSTYKAHPVLQFLLLFFGAAAFEQSALKWSAQHRTHHQFVDTERDPYSIKRGFWYAHIGWLIFYRQFTDYNNVRDLQRNPLVMNQHKYYMAWAIGSGVVLPVLIGALTGHALGAFLLAVCMRITLIYHGTFCINSVCHMFGKATYDIYSTAKDHWFAAILTMGEGYHNYHHHFPADYRNGVRWYHWDPTKWLILAASWVGLASDLKRISKYKIMAACLRAKHQTAEDKLKLLPAHPRLIIIQKRMKTQYERLKHTLIEWEHHALDYRDAVCKRIADSSRQAREARLQKMMESRQRFQQSLKDWELLYRSILRFAKA